MSYAVDANGNVNTESLTANNVNLASNSSNTIGGTLNFTGSLNINGNLTTSNLQCRNFDYNQSLQLYGNLSTGPVTTNNISSSSTGSMIVNSRLGTNYQSTWNSSTLFQSNTVANKATLELFLNQPVLQNIPLNTTPNTVATSDNNFYLPIQDIGYLYTQSSNFVIFSQGSINPPNGTIYIDATYFSTANAQVQAETIANKFISNLIYIYLNASPYTVVLYFGNGFINGISGVRVALQPFNGYFEFLVSAGWAYVFGVTNENSLSNYPSTWMSDLGV